MVAIVSVMDATINKLKFIAWLESIDKDEIPIWTRRSNGDIVRYNETVTFEQRGLYLPIPSHLLT